MFVAAVIAGALAAPVTAAAGSGESASQNAETSNAILRNDIAHYGNQPVSALGAPSAQRQSPAAVVVRVDGGFDWVSGGVGAAGGVGLLLVAAGAASAMWRLQRPDEARTSAGPREGV